ncbi:MAG: hypothetical protein WDA27_03420 [Actinomycetota bacterium]
MELARTLCVRIPSASLAASVAPLDVHIWQDGSESRLVRIQGG